MINLCVFAGRLTAEPKLEKIPSGVSVTRFSIGITKDKDTSYFPRITAWRQNAEFLSTYAHKGDLIGVVCHYESRSWEDKDGNRKYGEDFVADKVQILSHSQKNSNTSGNLYSESENNWEKAPNQATDGNVNEFDNPFGLDDSDLPF